MEVDQTKNLVSYGSTPGSGAIKLFSCSTQLSMKFQVLMKPKMLKSTDFSCFQTLRYCIYIMLINVKMSIIVDILTFMRKINFVLSRVENAKSFITSGSG